MQNAEQGDGTLWQRVMHRDKLAPIDRLYREYGLDEFQGIDITNETDQEFIDFVNRIRTKGPKFSIYSQEQLEHFAKKINELRKN